MTIPRRQFRSTALQEKRGCISEKDLERLKFDLMVAKRHLFLLKQPEDIDLSNHVDIAVLSYYVDKKFQSQIADIEAEVEELKKQKITESRDRLSEIKAEIQVLRDLSEKLKTKMLDEL